MSVNGQENAPQPIKTVVLPATRAALTWDRATDALLAAAEADEAKARESYEVAKAAYQEARQATHLIRQLRQLATVAGAGAVAKLAPPTRIRTHHIGKHAANGPCKGCPPAQEAQTNE